MIGEPVRRAIVASVNLLRLRGMSVDHWIEVDEVTLAASLVFSVRGDIGDPAGLVEELRDSMDPLLREEVLNITATRSKGRGRPKKSGEPPAEGMTIRCILR